MITSSQGWHHGKTGAFYFYIGFKDYIVVFSKPKSRCDQTAIPPGLTVGWGFVDCSNDIQGYESFRMSCCSVHNTQFIFQKQNVIPYLVAIAMSSLAVWTHRLLAGEVGLGFD
ncbi:hypothetical protein KOI40_06690 [Aestuariicella sp. G3-2]|uniref:hypothetical protein n=1 Tax=Pseudomaricurvus albidus TaxID=2842452 RepID=UPI001C0D7320|nr:hypothetical protein [Aestuariicella albida]MBU3069502.1 hypothetical protein [Aestuariicella albida]